MFMESFKVFYAHFSFKKDIVRRAKTIYLIHSLKKIAIDILALKLDNFIKISIM